MRWQSEETNNAGHEHPGKMRVQPNYRDRLQRQAQHTLFIELRKSRTQPTNLDNMRMRTNHSTSRLFLAHVHEPKLFQVFREKTTIIDCRQVPTTTVVSIGMPAMSGAHILKITPENISRQRYISVWNSLYDPAAKKWKVANLSVREDRNQ